MAHILLIDDDAILKETFGALMGRLGHGLTWAGSLAEGREALAQGRFDVVLLDLRLPDGYGLDLLPELRAAPGSPEIIIVTAQDDPEGAALAIKSGAWDYIQKPLTPNRVSLPLTRALEYRAQKAARRPRAALKREGIIGMGPSMEASLDLVAQAADSDASVLIAGETGTGKELFARAIHANSSRATNNFVVVDCAALPETLVESVLFGHVKGAFTDADRDRDGLFKLADGGTLFLDEIGELSQGIQKTFLRVLQDGRFRPVGSKNELQSDFRLVSATNRDLSVMAAGGVFREDLLYRLRTIVITLPPLRQRVEDIRPLALHYMNRFCERYRLPVKGVAEEFLQALCAYTWPGNVRELGSTMERVVLAHRGEPMLYPKHLPDEIRIQVLRAGAACEPPAREAVPGGHAVPAWKEYRRRALDTAEEAYLRELLTACGGNVVRGAKLSGLSPSRLYDLFRKYNLPTRA